MLEELKQKVWQANLDLVKSGLVIFTWGNASAIDRATGLVVIQPSGVGYDVMKPEDMVVVDLEGNVVEGSLRPSSDTAQVGRNIPNIGTTHSDYFHNDIPCTRDMKKAEVFGEYEKETGNVIVERFRNMNPDDTPAVLVRNHGPFTWGTDAANAVHNAVVLEEVAKMAFISSTLQLPTLDVIDHVPSMNKHLIEKHYSRKHGPNAYYGQKGTDQGQPSPPCASRACHSERSEESDN